VVERGRGPARIAAVRDAFEARLRERIPEVAIVGATAQRLPNTSAVTFQGVDAASLLAELSRRGLHASAGSACQAGSPRPSHVLRAMGLTAAAARATIRFSFGPDPTVDEAARAVTIVVEALPLASRAG
jgi:cysteine desulfurase